MAMRARSQDLEAFGERHKGLTTQSATHQINHRLWQVREIAERLVLDAAVFTVTATQQMRLVHTALVAAPCGDDVHGATTFWHAYNNSISALTYQRFSDYILYPINLPTTLETKKNRDQLTTRPLKSAGTSG